MSNEIGMFIVELCDKYYKPNPSLTIALPAMLLSILRNNFVCPCVTIIAAKEACPIINEHSCVTDKNYKQGAYFLITPAIALFSFFTCWYFVSNKKRKCSGCQKRKEVSGSHGCKECSIIWYRYYLESLQSLLAPISWISIALLDGQSYACLVTPLPYVDDGPCDEESSKKSTAYKENRFKSREYGYQLVMAASIFALLVHLVMLLAFSQQTSEDQVQPTRKVVKEKSGKIGTTYYKTVKKTQEHEEYTDMRNGRTTYRARRSYREESKEKQI